MKVVSGTKYIQMNPGGSAAAPDKSRVYGFIHESVKRSFSCDLKQDYKPGVRWLIELTTAVKVFRY